MVTFTPVSKGGDTPATNKPPTFTPVDATPPPTPAEQDAHKNLPYAAGGDKEQAVERGLTYGWMRELNADEYAAVVGAENLYRKTTGKPVPYGMTEARHAMLQEQRKAEKDFHAKHPMLDDALELAGGMAAPGVGELGTFVKGGANFATKAARSMLGGGAIGAVAGASDENDRVGGARRGAEWGATLSGGLHLLGSAVASGLPKIAAITKQPLVETWRGIQKLFGTEKPGLTPEQVAKAQKDALEYVHKVAEAAKKTPQDIADNADAKLGKPVLGAEAIGRPGISALGAVGRRSGETPDALESTLRTRAHWAPSRIASDLSEVTKVDPSAIEGDFNEQLKGLRKEAAPLYDVAYQDKVDTPKLRDFLNRDAVKKALSRARKIASNEGVDPETVGLVLKSPAQIGHNSDGALELIEVKNPTMRTWDYIKRGLDDELESSRDKITKKLDLNEEGRAVLSTLTDMRTELFKESPAYENAVAHGGEAPRQKEAYDAAKDLMRPQVTEQTFRERVKKFTPAQREALKGGLIADIYNSVRNGKLKLKDMQTPAYTEKLRHVLGFDEANQFLAKAESEARMGAQGGRMMPGSQSATMELQAADKERDEGATALARAGFEAGKGSYGKALMHIASGGKAVAQTAGMDEAMRNEVGRLLMMSPKELSKVLGDHEKSRGAKPAESFVRQLSRDPKVLAAARRLTLAFSGVEGQRQ